MFNQISLQNARATHPETFLTVLPPDPRSLLTQEISNSTSNWIKRTLPHPTGIQRLNTRKILSEKRQQREKAQLENHQAHKLLQHVAKSELSRIKKFCEMNDQIINIVDPITNQTPMHRCAVENNEKMMKFLMVNLRTVDPDVQDSVGRTALMLAAEYGNIEAVELLLEGAGFTDRASAEVTDILGRDVFCYAAIDTTSRHRKILNILIENEDTKEQVKKSISLLELVKKGPPDPNELPLEPGNTTSYSDYALDLIKVEADVNLVDRKTGKTVLMFACENKDERVTRALLRNGALPNPIEFFEKCSAAHIAAKSGSVDCLQALSAYSADFSILNKRNESALHVAALGGCEKCCKFLVQRGVDPSLKSKDKNTAKLAAKSEGKKKAAKECLRGEKAWKKNMANSESGVKDEKVPQDWQIRLYDWLYDPERQAHIRLNLTLVYANLEAEKGNTLESAPVIPSIPEEPKKKKGAKKGKKGKKGKKKDTIPDKFIPVNEVITILQDLEPPIDGENFNELNKKLDVDPVNRGNIGIEDFLGGKKFLDKKFLMSAFADKKKKKKKGKGKGKKGKPVKGAMPISLVTVKSMPKRLGGMGCEFVQMSEPPVLVDCNDESDVDTDYTSDESEDESEVDSDSSEMEISKSVAVVSGTDSRSRMQSRFGNKMNASKNHKFTDDSKWYETGRGNACKLWKQLNVIIKNNDFSALVQAIQNSDETQQVPIDVKDRYHKTPLMLAAGLANPKFVKYLLDSGANIDLTDQFGWTALHHACTAVGQKKTNKKNTVKDHIDDSGDSMVVGMDVIRLLVEAGANVNQKTTCGATPLIRAVQSSSQPAVEYLLQNGADLLYAIEGKKGKEKNIVDYALEWADVNLYQYLKGIYDARMEKEGDKKNKKKDKAKPKKSEKPKTPTDKTRLPSLTNSESIEPPLGYSLITKKEMVREKAAQRQKYGMEMDFGGFKKPLLQNIQHKIAIKNF